MWFPGATWVLVRAPGERAGNDQAVLAPATTEGAPARPWFLVSNGGAGEQNVSIVEPSGLRLQVVVRDVRALADVGDYLAGVLLRVGGSVGAA